MTETLHISFEDLQPETELQERINAIRNSAREELPQAKTVSESLRLQYIISTATEKQLTWIFEQQKDITDSQLVELLSRFSQSDEEAAKVEKLLENESLNPQEITVILASDGAFESRLLVTVPQADDDGTVQFQRVYLNAKVPCIQKTINELVAQGKSTFSIDNLPINELEERLWSDKERFDITTYEPYEDPSKNQLFLVCAALGSIGSIKQSIRIIPSNLIGN